MVGADARRRLVDLVVDDLAGAVSLELRASLRWRERRRRDFSHAIVDRLVRDGNVVVDVGANWGLFARRFLRLVGSGGHVHLFEANPAMLAFLAPLAERPNATLHPVALSDAAGAAQLRVPVVEGQANEGMATLEDAPRVHAVAESLRVPVRRLDDVLPPDAGVSFVKCDVEGHELRVLKGADGLLRRSRPTLLVEIEQRHQRRDVGETFEYLAGSAFAGFHVRGRRLRPLEEFDAARDQLARLPALDASRLPSDYVKDFLFVPAEKARDVLSALSA